MFNRIKNKLFDLDRKYKKIILMIIDFIIVIISYFSSMFLRLQNLNFINDINQFYITIILGIFTLIIFEKLHVYNTIIRFISENFIKSILITSFLSASFLFFCKLMFNIFIPNSVFIIFFLISLTLFIFIRFFIKYLYLESLLENKINIAIYGTDQEDKNFFNYLEKNKYYKPILFIDEHSNMINKNIGGIKVFSIFDSIDEIRKNDIKIILVSNRNLKSLQNQQILHLIENFNVDIKPIPNINYLISNKIKLNQLKNISITQFLGRKQVSPNKNLLKKNVFNKNIFISGAGGSIGSELCKQIIKLSPKSIVLFENSEYALYKILNYLKEMSKSLKNKPSLFSLLGDIKNNEHLHNAFTTFKIEAVYHCAAYKHVHLVEKNIFVSLNNNIIGTKNLIDNSVKYDVKTFTLISSDKAVRPFNFMGASKRVSELICQLYAKSKINMIISVVRFGNVLGSSGSVIPIFNEQIKKGGPVYVTNKNVERYFMTIREAAELVLQASSLAKGGEIFVLDMGKSIKILDLAKKMIKLSGKNFYLNQDKQKT